jgi:probable rRNA maturation factor
MTIYIRNLTKRKINTELLKKLARLVAIELRLEGETSIVLTNDKKMRELNHVYRKIDKPTDVLSFDQSALNNQRPVGEIFINLDDCQKIKEYQEFFPFTPKSEDILHFLMAHGFLHLAGFNDETEKKRQEIIKKGNDILKKITLHV